MTTMMTMMNDTPDRMVDAGNETLAYWRFGKGPDVVMVHGWPLDARTFRNVAPALAERFTVHLFDLPGIRSSTQNQTASFEGHTRALRSAIDTLDLDSYALVAHDSGGVFARMLAARDPRVRGLVLEGSEIPGHRPPMFETYVKLSRLPGFDRILLTVLRSSTMRRSRFGFGGCFTEPGFVDGEFYDLFLAPMLADRAKGDGHLALMRAVNFDEVDQLRDLHGSIRAPVLCVWGTDDPFFPIEKARAMLPQFADASLVEIPGAKLFAHEDHPKAFVQHAMPFLDRCLAGTSKRSAA